MKTSDLRRYLTLAAPHVSTLESAWLGCMKMAQGSHKERLKMKEAIVTFTILLPLLLPLNVSAQALYFGPGTSFEEAGPKQPSSRSALTFGLDSSWSKNTILGAAHAPGMYGSFYRTDLYIMTPCAGASGYVVFDIWSLPNGGTDNSKQISQRYSISAGGFGIIQDVVGTFNQTGGSTLDIEVNSSLSTVTTSCREVSSWAKTYTQAPTGGNYSTGLLSTFGNTSASYSTRYGAITGIEQNASSRTNVIVYSHYGSSGTVRLIVFDEKGNNIGTKDIYINPYSATQVSLSEFSIASPGGSLTARGKSPHWMRHEACTRIGAATELT